MAQAFISLLDWRRANGLSQIEAAALVPMAQSGWSLIERGESVPRPKMAQRISELTGVPIGVLLQPYYRPPEPRRGSRPYKAPKPTKQAAL